MTEDEIQNIFKQCQRFLRGHYPVSLKDQLKSLANKVDGDEKVDFYGSGKLIEELEQEVAAILGKSKAVFLPSGTMAQVMALRIWCDLAENHNIGLHPTSHLERHEEKAYLFLHHLKGNLLGEVHRVLSLSDIKKSLVPLAAVIIELPQRESGGLLPKWDELLAISNWCKSNKVNFHLDGARLWECGPYYQKSYIDICALFDSVYVSFYKGLGGMGGAILAGPDDFIKNAKIWQRRHGGNLITLYPYIVSARTSLRLRLLKMQMYHDKAKEIAEKISTIEKIKIEPNTPQTNMMHIFFEGNIAQFEKAAIKVAVEDRVWVFSKLQPTSNPDIGKFELSVGDAILDIPIEDIYWIFRKIVD